MSSSSIPGMGKQLQGLDLDEQQLARVEAIVLSMTPQERRMPHVISTQRRRRIAAGKRDLDRRGEQAHGRPQADGEDDEADGEGQDADAPAGRGRAEALAFPLHQRERHIQHMAVKIRLTRVGSKKNPIYRVVVADSRSPRDGRFIEIVGRYNPQTDPSTIDLDEAKIKDWMAKGAQPTAPVLAPHQGGWLQRLNPRWPSFSSGSRGGSSTSRTRCAWRPRSARTRSCSTSTSLRTTSAR